MTVVRASDNGFRTSRESIAPPIDFQAARVGAHAHTGFSDSTILAPRILGMLPKVTSEPVVVSIREI